MNGGNCRIEIPDASSNEKYFRLDDSQLPSTHLSGYGTVLSRNPKSAYRRFPSKPTDSGFHCGRNRRAVAEHGSSVRVFDDC